MDLEELGDMQRKALKQLRENVIHDCNLHDTSDVFLLRWLIARNFDLAKAEKMLRDSLVWRTQYRVNYIRKEFVTPEVLAKYHPVGPIGQDKRFHPLWLFRYGREDLRGILSSVRRNDFTKHLMKLVETNSWLGNNYPENQRPKANTIIQSTFIIDLDGFSLLHVTYKPGLDFMIQLIQIYQNNYPECVSKIIFINAPKIFSTTFSIFRRFMDERTANKIQIFSHDSDVWKPALLAEINANQLPACYGGTMKDADGNPNCVSKCNMGGLVPKSYYLCNNQVNSEQLLNHKTLVLTPRSKERFQFRIERPGSILSWNFYSKNGDIGFAVYSKQLNASTDRNHDLVPAVLYSRVDCHLTPENGEISCSEPDIYVIEFDNSFSYLHSKKIWYSITVSTP